MSVQKGEDPQFFQIIDHVLRSKGFDANRYKTNYIKRRIAVRMRATGSGDYQDYYQRLLSDPKEAGALLDRLTIHVTEFFRDPSVFTALEEKVFPDLSTGPDGVARIWSAGCSTGEECYTLALSLSTWASRNKGPDFSILGTDIDPESVRKAERAEYPEASLRNVPRSMVATGFHHAGGRYSVLEPFKKKVHFRTHDILGKWTSVFSGFRLILCRNLLIYLTSEQQQDLYERFYKALTPGGYLVLGLTETLLGPSRRFFRCIDVRNRIYQGLPQTETRAGSEEGVG